MAQRPGARPPLAATHPVNNAARRDRFRRRGHEAGQDCFIVRDANGQVLNYVYFEEEPGRRSAARLPTRDEARRIAANVAKPRGTPARVLFAASTRDSF
jgi:hypothetical protein